MVFLLDHSVLSVVELMYWQERAVLILSIGQNQLIFSRWICLICDCSFQATFPLKMLPPLKNCFLEIFLALTFLP